LTASYTETEQDINSADNQVFASGKTDFPTQDYEVTINQSIYSFSHWAGFDKAKAEVQLLDAELQAIRQDLIERVADRYFAALAANENFEAIKAEKKAVAKQYELAKEKGTKLGRKSDLLDAEARFFQVESREIELRNRLQVALQQLRELTGNVPASLTLMGEAFELISPEPNDPEQILQTALASNPEVAASRHAVEVANQQLRQEKGQRYPTLDLALRFNNSETEGTLFGGGSDVDTADIAVSLNVPLYSGGAVSSKIRESSRLLARAQQQLEMQIRRVQTDIFSAYDGILAAIAKVNALAKSVASHEQALEARQEESRAGLVPTIALLDAERDLFFARVEYANARYDYILNTLRLKRVVGSLSDADVAFVDG
ncbi:MAG: TolC family outer membrane protein, partial [Pseudomonadales bacterium]